MAKSKTIAAISADLCSGCEACLSVMPHDDCIVKLDAPPTTPFAMVVVDVKNEETAIHEANLLGIPVIGLVDTNCDPRGVDYIIPSNDDAIRAIKLLSATVANAVLEGQELRKDRPAAREAADAARQQQAVPEIADEELLGEATLAKLMSGEFDEELEAKAAKAAAAEQPAANTGADVQPAQPQPNETQPKE